ncbi:MAG TPA: putative glycolipid-binding domain-containing protein [Pseudonocardiaceae bacterium]|nr:putative glycolipid-binding domain-containing protein [Pseudonocardiaceae bacterium]
MNTPQTGEQLAGEAAARRPPLATRMLAWSGLDAPRLEAARAVLSERSMRASGSMVSAPGADTAPFSSSYALSTDETGVLRRLTVRTVCLQGEQHVTLTRSEEGIWLVDHGAGAARTDFDGALDVDLAFSPLFNALPVRRLALYRTPGEHELPMVFVSLPDLEVQLVRQTYRSVSVGDPAVVGFHSGSFDVEITVDSDGLVLDYPGLAKRA